LNALVTGAGGFLGRYIVEQLLARGDRVRTLCFSPHIELERLGVECVRADLRDPAAVEAACRGIDTVFHAAAVSGVGGPWRRYYGVNVLGTRHVVSACRACKVRRLIFTSSPSVTFDGADQRGIDESTPYPTRWLAQYPRSKALAEQCVLASNDGDGLLTCALRPHLLWGPGDRHLIPEMLRRARSGQLRRVGDGTNTIDMVYVENAARAHLLAADALTPGSPVAGKAYFITQGEPVNCWQWIDRLLSLVGLPAVKSSISFRAAWMLGAALETVYALRRSAADPPMTRFLAAQLSKSHYFNIGAARRDFGYEPTISTAEGMTRLAASIGDSKTK
jgi:2-alkyl-3-oxoalkanoate reductase